MISAITAKPHHSAKDFTGMIFGRLTAIERLAEEHKPTRYLCSCTCGNTTMVLGDSLVKGATKSCGCLHKEVVSELLTKHGMHDKPEYKAFHSMWQRCSNQNNAKYASYKDRAPPESWRDFNVFLADVGERPGVGYSLDRVDNDKPYGPENVKWSTSKEQANNREYGKWITHNGETHNVAQWASILGISRSAIHGRLHMGWSVKQILETPVHPRRNK